MSTTLRRSDSVCSKMDERMPIRMFRSILVDGAEYVLPYGGTSQYSRDGTSASACGLAALNFARIVFSMEQAGLQDMTLLQAVMDRKCVEEATATCTLWSGNLHLAVEDMCHVSLFARTLKLKTTTYGLSGVSEFQSLLTELSSLESSAVVIITRPPEIIACLKLRLGTRNVFIIFDSHPCPSSSNGAGMIASTSTERTARRLAELLRTVDLPDSWQAKLLARYSGHVFVPHDVKTSIPVLPQVALEPGLARLPMQPERSDSSEARSKNILLKGELQRLESEIEEAVGSLQQKSVTQRQQHQSGSSSGPPKYFDRPSAQPRHFSSPPFYTTSTSTFNPFDPDFLSAASNSVLVPPPSDCDDSTMRLRHKSNKEDRAPSAQLTELTDPKVFMCGICFEEMLDDSIIRLDPCGHTFCRECLRGHVTTRLSERRFPILCPTCTASNGKERGTEKGKGKVWCKVWRKGKGMEMKKATAAEVSQSLALDLGLEDGQYRIWTEMELAVFSTLLHCPKCQQEIFVADKEVSIVTCPLPICNHVWCKRCQKSMILDFDGPKHSCDGSLELEYLMEQEGWKCCPTCKTPIQKESGCNHVTCIAPGCNTHFCYNCGGLIARPAPDERIGDAVSNHFKKCML